MKPRLLLSVLFLGVHGLAIAQTPSFTGSWKVNWQGEKRVDEATLVIAEDGGGSWKALAHNRNDICAGKEVPILFKRTGASEASVRVKSSEVIPGCNDVTLRLKLVDEKSMSGTRGKFELTAVRN